MSTEIKFTDTAVVWNHGQQVVTTGGDILCTLVDENGNALPDRERIAGRIVNCWNAGRYYEEPLDQNKQVIAGIVIMLLDLYEIDDKYTIISEPDWPGCLDDVLSDGTRMVAFRSWFLRYDINTLLKFGRDMPAAKQSIVDGFYELCKKRLGSMGMEHSISRFNAEALVIDDECLALKVTIV